jgi:hypothetical protein
MKKGLTFFVLGFALVLLVTGFVSAAPTDVADGIRQAGSTIYEIVKPILEVVTGDTSGGQDFLAKVLFLMIIFAVVWTAVGRIAFFAENTWVMVVVSSAVSVLAIRWFGDSSVVQTAILPYSAFGIAVTCFLPFVLFFFLVKDFTPVFRKLAWIFFAVIFTGLWIARDEARSFSYIYLVTALLGLAVLFFDGTIQKYMVKAKIERAHHYHGNKLIMSLREELEEVDERYKKDGKAYMAIYSNDTGHKGWDADRKEIQKRIEEIRAKY